MRKTIIVIMMSLMIIISGLAGCSEPNVETLPKSTETFNLTTVDKISQQSELTSELPGAGGKLEILSHTMVVESGTITISGTARNSGTASLTYAEVYVRFYEADGKLVEWTSCEICGAPLETEWRDMKINELNPGENWDFKIVLMGPSPEIIKRYEVSVGVFR